MMIHRRKLLRALVWFAGPPIARYLDLMLPAAAETMALRALLTVPALNIVDAPLSDKNPVAGYICKSSADGKQLFIEYLIGLDDLGTGDQDKSVITNLGPHTITIKDGAGAAIATFNLSEKQARTHFRYPWLTDKPVLTPRDLIDQHLMFPFGNPPAELHKVIPVVYDGPNAFPGMTRYMGQTGERPELGEVTEWTAKYMMDGDPANVLNVAEGAGTAPMFFQDKATGKLVDKLAHPKANNYGGGPGYRGSPWLAPAPTVDGNPVDVFPNIAHLPEVSYAAALITRSGWHLRNLQHWANNCLLTDGDSSQDGTAPMVMASTETRAFAWELRTVAMAEVATREFEKRDALPADCVPSSYFTAVLSNIRKFYIAPRLVDPDKQLLRVFETDGSIAPWQVEYQLETLAFMVLTGHQDWNDVFLWALGNPIARTNGKSGWPPSIPCAYYIWIGPPGARLPDWRTIWDVSKQKPLEQGGARGGLLGNQYSQKCVDDIAADPFCGGNFAPGTNDEYPMSTHAVFSMALYLHQIGALDVLTAWPDLPVCYANLRRMFLNKEAAVRKIYNHGNWSFNGRDAETFDVTKFPPNTFVPSRLP